MAAEPALATAPAPHAEAPHYSPAYLRWALALLCLVYVVNFVDRQILSILLQSIKRDLQLSDTQLGLLSGTAFGIFYATLGVPIARLADRFSRKWVMTICLVLWSGFTALCGSAAGFGALLAYRIGVGVGEAGGSPPAHSMISDYFPPERRATALAIFSLGVPIGILVGFLAGGWLDQTLGWRRAFVFVGLPGLIVAAVVAIVLREPPRGHSEGLTAAGASPSAMTVIRFLWRSRSFRHLSFASGLYAFVGYSVISWAPSFLIRSHGMQSGEVGTWLSLIIGVGGGVGVYLGGVAADRWAASDARARVRLPALAMAAAFPFGFFIYTTSSTALALALLTVPTLLGGVYQGPTFAVTQFLATPKMRATAAAVLLFMINIIGLALGPWATGWISDRLAPGFGADSLRYALLIVSCLLAWSALHFWLAGRTLLADLAFVRAASEKEGRPGQLR
jgi:predicted MFS family arabinose efflux permease